MLAADSSQYGSIPHPTRQGIYIINQASCLIYVKFIVRALHISLEQGIFTCLRFGISVKTTQRESRDGCIMCIFYCCFIAAQARRERERSCNQRYESKKLPFHSIQFFFLAANLQRILQKLALFSLLLCKLFILGAFFKFFSDFEA